MQSILDHKLALLSRPVASTWEGGSNCSVTVASLDFKGGRLVHPGLVTSLLLCPLAYALQVAPVDRYRGRYDPALSPRGFGCAWGPGLSPHAR